MEASRRDSEDLGQTLRPTLYVGLGGFGCSVLRKLKAAIQRVEPDAVDGFCFLGLDTHTRQLDDDLAENEYVPLAIGVDPNQAAKMHPEFLGWYRELAGKFRARNIQAGADATKAIGRLAFRHPTSFQEFLNKLNRAARRLTRFREQFASGRPPKVYVISSLGGGTGAGCLVDVLAILGQYFRTNIGADFPFQAVLATPEVLIGEAPPGKVPDFFANTYATLKELHHFLLDSAVVRFDEGRYESVEIDRSLLPDPIHLVGDTNEEGTAIVSRFAELQDMVASYLLSEIVTPIEDSAGQPRIQDKENPYSSKRGAGDMMQAFASFGLVRTGLPDDLIHEIFALRIVQAVLTTELTQPGDVFDEAANWIESENLREQGIDQLQDLLRQKVGPDTLRVALDATGTLLDRGYKYKALAREARQFSRDVEQSWEESQRPRISEAASAEGERLLQDLQDEFDRDRKSTGVGKAVAVLNEVEKQLKTHQQALKEEIKETRELLKQQLESDVKGTIDAIGNATKGFWGRKGRVRDAVSDFNHRLEAVLTKRTELWIEEQAEHIYARMLECIEELRSQFKPIVDALTARKARCEERITRKSLELDRLADIGRRGPGNRFSLIDAQQANALYDRLIRPEVEGTISACRSRWLEDGSLMDADSEPDAWLEEVLRSIKKAEVQPVVDEWDVVSLLEEFYGDREALQRLFDDLQRLASPLFNLDPNRAEPSYDTYWIVAIHPERRAEFDRTYKNYLKGHGFIFAEFDSKSEVILYQLKYGYTVSSFRRLSTYEADYERLLQDYLELRSERKAARPIHSWPEAENWETLVPRPEEEAALKWFIVGRAFSRLFPSAGASSPTDSKNKAFLFARGSYYYMVSADADGVEREERIGNGLVDAVNNFADRPDWQDEMRTKIQRKAEEVGFDTVTDRLRNEYLPTLNEEIESATKADRARILPKLKAALRDYMREDLFTERV